MELKIYGKITVGRKAIFFTEKGDNEMKICPRCGNKEFYVIAHVAQEWKVNENGYFCDVTQDCIGVTHNPDDTDLWECTECGYEDRGSEFNIK